MITVIVFLGDCRQCAVVRGADAMDFRAKFALDKVGDGRGVDENRIREIDVEMQRGVGLRAVAGSENADFARAQVVAGKRLAAREQDETQNAILELLPVFRFFWSFVIRVDVEDEGDGGPGPAEDGVDGAVEQQIRVLELVRRGPVELVLAGLTGVGRDAVLAVVADDLEGRDLARHAGERVELAGAGAALVLGGEEDVAEGDTGERFAK